MAERTVEALLTGLRSKYPGVYDDVPDSTLLLGLKLRVPGVYDDIIDPELGFIGEPQKLTLREVLTSEPAQNLYSKGLKSGVETLGKLPIAGGLPATTLKRIPEIISRPIGALEAIAAGRSPAQGFMQPEKQPAFGASTAKALEAYGVKGEAAQTILGGMTGTAFEALSSIAIGGAPTSIARTYTAAQARSIGKLTSVLEDTLQKAGLVKEQSTAVAREIVARGWARGVGRTPWRINQSIEAITKNRDAFAKVLGEQFKASQAPTAKAGATAAPRRPVELASPTDQSFVVGKRILTPTGESVSIPVGVSKFEITPEARLERIRRRGRLLSIKGRAESVRARFEGVPTFKSSNEAIAYGKSIKDKPELVEGLQAAKESLAAPIADAKKVGDLQRGLDLSVRAQFYSEAIKAAEQVGGKEVSTQALIEANEVTKNKIVQEASASLDKNLESSIKDSSKIKEELSRRVNDHIGEEGSVATARFNEVATNLGGEVEKAVSKSSSVAKMLGTPYFNALKYPAAKPIWNAVRDSVDLKHETMLDGAEILDPHYLFKLPQESGAKITEALRQGNLASVRRYFSDAELIDIFKLSPQEIDAYHRVQGLYKYGLELRISQRKLSLGYGDMSLEEQVAYDKRISREVSALGGYVSQQRLSGDWAVVRPGDDFFYNQYASKYEAEQAVKKLGSGAKLYLRKETPREAYGNLTLNELENLIEAAGADESAAEIAKLRAEIQKRGFSAHWIRRQDDPGYEWTWDNVIHSAIEYLDSSTTAYSKTLGRVTSGKAYRKAVKGMSPDLASYWANYLDTYFDVPTAGYPAAQKFMQTWKLSGDVGNLLVNLTQPITMIWPKIAGYYPKFSLEPEVQFLRAEKQAVAYITDVLSKRNPAIPRDLATIIRTLDRRGVLGKQMNRWILGIKGLRESQFEQVIGFTNVAGEYKNRLSGVFAAYNIATDKLKLRRVEQKYSFIRDFTSETNLDYGRHNVPTLIQNLGKARNLARMAYTFRHMQVSYLQFMFKQFRSGNPAQYMRALAALVAQAGVKGLPFAGAAAALYLGITGRHLEGDTRVKASDLGIPGELTDVTLSGMYTLAGADPSQQLGWGDVVRTQGSWKDMLIDNTLGAPAGFAEQFGKSINLLERGEYLKSLEYMSPDMLRHLMRAKREREGGITTFGGEKLGEPTLGDTIRTSLGIQSSRITKMQMEAVSKQAVEERRRRQVSKLSERAYRALFVDKNPREYLRIRREMIRHRIRPSKQSRAAWRDKFIGRERRGTKATRRERYKLREAFRR